MRLQFIGIDPGCNGDNCPTVWVDEEADEVVVQGWKADEATRARCRGTSGIPDTEAIVRLPARMASILKEACDVADGAALR
jgi:hypothetical protein